MRRHLSRGADAKPTRPNGVHVAVRLAPKPARQSLQAPSASGQSHAPELVLRVTEVVSCFVQHCYAGLLG